MTVFKVFGRFTVCLIKNLQLMYLLELQAGHINSIKTISLKSALLFLTNWKQQRNKHYLNC